MQPTHNLEITPDVVQQILNLGETLASKQKTNSDGASLQPLVDEYLNHLKDTKSKADYSHNFYTFRVFLRLFPIEFIGDFNLETIRKFVAVRKRSKIADNTIRTDVGDLIRFNQWLIEKSVKSRAEKFSYKETNAPSKSHCLERCAGYIPREQVFLFWKIAMKNRAFKKEYDMRLYQSIISMYVFNGTRLNEARFMFREKTFVNKGYIQLHPDYNKAGRADKVFLHPNYIPIIEKFLHCRDVERADSPWLFSYSDSTKPVSDSTIYRWFKQINKTLAQKYGYTRKVTSHLLRHCLGHNSIMDGVPAPQVQKVLRHSDVSTTLRLYTHAGDKEAMEGIRSYNPFALDDEQKPYDFVK